MDGKLSCSGVQAEKPGGQKEELEEMLLKVVRESEKKNKVSEKNLWEKTGASYQFQLQKEHNINKP